MKNNNPIEENNKKVTVNSSSACGELSSIYNKIKKIKTMLIVLCGPLGLI